ncbi:MAG TPA: VOC family protein [Bryobacteraceae bacterium]|nr:VOC family protein [Bryobacteraceae bacterium]
MAGAPSLHHVGYVVPSAGDALGAHVAAIGGEGTRVWDDPLQKVRVAFARMPGDATSIEFIEPDGPDSTVAKFLERGGGLHHVCYEVDTIKGALADLCGHGALVVRRPRPAAAFGGRLISWVVLPSRLLIELLERTPPQS